MIYRHSMTVKHNPDEGLYGDCFRASLATMFQTPYVSDIPHFLAEGDDRPEWWEEMVMWFRERGIEVLVWEEPKLVPELRCVACGPSPRNLEMAHAVVWQDGRVLWDPHESRLGLADAPTVFFSFAIVDATLYDAWRESIRCG